MYNNDLRTEIARAKGRGSAGSGSHHWLMQRMTAIVLVILTVWSVFFIGCSLKHDLSTFITLLQKPFNTLPIAILAVTALYHAALGMQVVIEDYVSCLCYRNALIIALKIFCFITNVSFVFALFYLMTL
jgi:succinate dehydrogenase / fumarate reductase membrane anchor subunit